MTQDPRVAVLFGGRSTEHEVSLVSARTVANALMQAGFEILPVGITPDGCWLDEERSAAFLLGDEKSLDPLGTPVAPTLKRLLESQVDVVFPVLHGTWGEDGAVQGLCEMADLPFVGAGVTASAVGMDKAVAKSVLQRAGVPVVEYRVFWRREVELDLSGCLERAGEIPLPLFVKPSVGGSSVGVTRVDNSRDLPDALQFALRFDDAVLVERAVLGRELECSVLGYEKLEASCLGEIVPSRSFYDYEDKYLEDKAGLIAPAELSAIEADRARSLAVGAFAALGGWGMARVDFLLEDNGVLFVNEVNTIPGFTQISMYPRLWEISGVPLPDLVTRLVDIALRRHADRKRLDQGIRGWLEGLKEKRG